MPAQRVDLDGHVRVQRQLHQQVVQFLNAVDIEHAVIGIEPGDAPQMTPLALLLQALGQGFFSSALS